MEAAAFIDVLYAEAEKAGLKEFQICYDYRAGRSLSVFEGKPEKSDNDETQQIVFDVRLNGKSENLFLKRCRRLPMRRKLSETRLRTQH